MIGKILGKRYELLEEIGKGGMAYVYKARCILLNRIVAVKVLRDDLEGGDEFLARFNTEAQAAASLTHSNIVSIFDVGEDDGLHYIVMEYVDGITLKEYIKEKGKLGCCEALDIAYQICDALQAAHDKNIVHRDIKPHNILITEDRNIKVADFGIARSANGNTMTNNEEILGSVHYISPEQVKGEVADCRSDIYSLGISLYEMVSGELPFDADTPVAVAMMQMDAEPQPINSADVPKSVHQMIFKAISKNPEMRYQNASNFKYDMLSIIEDPGYELPDGHLYYVPEFELGSDESDGSSQIGRFQKTTAIVGGCITALLLVLVSIYVYNYISTYSLYIPTPDLAGETLETAGTICSEHGISLVVSDEVEKNGYEPGTIISQTPIKNDRIKEGAVVKVVISKAGDFVLDNYKGEPYKSVRKRLKEAGYETEVNFEESKSDKDTVLRQSPKAGTKLKKGDTVTLYVSNGAGENDNYVSVPKLTGKTYKASKVLLDDAELSVGKISGVDVPSDDDEVVSQAIPYTSKVKRGTTVDITLKSTKTDENTVDNSSVNSETESIDTTVNNSTHVHNNAGDN